MNSEELTSSDLKIIELALASMTIKGKDARRLVELIDKIDSMIKKRG